MKIFPTKAMSALVILWLLIPVASMADTGTASSSVVNTLTAEQIDDYLSGHGMGLAKVAELNGYPGPAHVLPLADDLELTSEQRQKTEALKSRVVAEATRIGKRIVRQEQALDALFAAKKADPKTVAALTDEIGRLQGRLRQVHLQAHLEQTRLLSAVQLTHYAQLRGYAP